MANKESRNYIFMDRGTGREVEVEVIVDWDKLARELGYRALGSKGKKSVSLNGAVKAKVAKP